MSGSVVDRVVGALVARVEAGEFRAGERLPPEGDLAADLAVSRLSLREAVRALTGAGVLEVRRGDGTFVTDLRPERLVRAAGAFLDLVDERGVAELFECRRVLEPAATALAATRIDDAALDGLAERCERMRGLTDPERLVAEDVDFHAAIVAATGNATLDSLAAAVAGRTARVRNLARRGPARRHGLDPRPARRDHARAAGAGLAGVVDRGDDARLRGRALGAGAPRRGRSVTLSRWGPRARPRGPGRGSARSRG